MKDKDVPSAVTGYPSGSVVVPPELRPTDTSGFYDIATQENGFSPPIETEGTHVSLLYDIIKVNYPLEISPIVPRDS